MVVFPNCKINIGLQIMGKRADGYHNLQTVFYPIVLKDALEILSDNENTTGFSFEHSGIIIDGEKQDNLCIKVYRLLQNDFPALPAAKMHLHKNIPIGAGLGGGSADAAFTLQLINDKFSLGLTQNDLINYAMKLGSDCAFFIVNKPCFATGRGEILESIELSLSSYKILIINPGIHINTGWAFSQLQLSNIKDNDLKNNILQPIETWKQSITNDFERPVFAAYPEIEKIRSTLYKEGAVYASMSGSGSSVYGIFEDKTAIDQNFPPHYFCKWV